MSMIEKKGVVSYENVSSPVPGAGVQALKPEPYDRPANAAAVFPAVVPRTIIRCIGGSPAVETQAVQYGFGVMA